jgi:hypothetical protein
MSNWITLKNLIVSKIKDDSGKITDDDIEISLNAAIQAYSRHRPDCKVASTTGNATHDYTLPEGWIDGFSRILLIEYPVDNVPTDYLDDDEYLIYQTTTVKKVRLLYYSPAITETFLISFTIPRTDLTILDNDADALCNLAASCCLEQLANAFAQTGDSTISADAVNYRSKASDFGYRAKRFRDLYKEHMGIKDDASTLAAIVTSDMDLKYPGGGARLTHPRWWRENR